MEEAFWKLRSGALALIGVLGAVRDGVRETPDRRPEGKTRPPERSAGRASWGKRAHSGSAPERPSGFVLQSRGEKRRL